MEVTKGKFAGVLQEVHSLLSRCTLVSFDCEFTGLRGSGVKEEWEDTPEERYRKLRQGSSKFALIQFGLCFFVKDDNDDNDDMKYKVFPFNFYLFPSYSLGRKVPQRIDRRFLCQPSSLLMLANSGLDFNKWIKDGVPYMRESDEAWWRNWRKKEEEPSQDELNQFLGFSQVFKMIVESKTPLVGHSIMLDLLHSYTHFIDDLPETLVTFKTELNKRLPSVYDTLLICDCDDIRPHLGVSPSLANVYNSLTRSQFPQVVTELPTSCTHYSSGKHFHEAAYDAFISGCVFVIMARILGREGSTDLFEATAAYRNRVYLFNCESTDALNLSGPEASVQKHHVFKLSFCKDVTTDDIRDLFSPFGGCRVSWINDTSARVTLYHREKAKEAYKALVATEGSMRGKPFIIAPCSTQTDTLIGKNVQQQEGPAQLGKRTHDDVSCTDESAPPSPKQPMFHVNTDW